ncbi:uncharacterized protein B0P05DRAFT_532792 [Gilbertella persicaria]|uniref:uncharacterized protein n=1 Tax=Gilbertella persicaria TaxID=101096 RepID=UPI002220AF27|nr:uncharacterized protein B0P05DRAFT_532792 [Gilbertella persicaria]KAI8086890.1 hypothetical protein B0P05DRAFT_532792 [Gilbertella persicaria]
MYTSMLLCKPSLCRISLIGPDILMHKKYVNDNLMRSSVSLNVKELEMIEQYVPKQHLCFVYKVTKVPKHQIKTRPGERWVEPLELECSVDFLSKPKCIIQRVFDHLHCKSVNRHDQKHLSSTRIPAQDQRNGVAEIGGLWKQKYHYLSPVQDKSPQIPMLGAGLSL